MLRAISNACFELQGEPAGLPTLFFFVRFLVVTSTRLRSGESEMLLGGPLLPRCGQVFFLVPLSADHSIVYK
jgi:hypothetical protein